MKKIDSLTSLRFFAAFAIVLGHTKGAFVATAWIGWFPFGYGVSCFFVLSGFILTYVYRDFCSKEELIDFAIARVARVWPLHLVTVIIFFLLIPNSEWFIGQASGHEIGIATANIFLVHAWIPSYGYFLSFNPVSWSLSTEIFFYLVFPLFRHKWAETWHWKTLFVVITVCMLLTITTARGVPDYFHENSMSVSAVGIGGISPFTRVIEFVLGMIAASVFQWLARIKPRGGIVLWTFIEIGGLCLVSMMHQYFQNFPSWLAGHDLNKSSWGYFMQSAAGAPAFMVIIIVIALNRGAVSKLLSAKPFVLLGEASFALYLTHLLFFMWLTKHRESLSDIPDAMLCALYWSACLGAAFLLWILVEKPCRNKLRSLLLRPRRELVGAL